MENASQQSRSNRSHFVELVPESGKTEQAFCYDSTSFWKIVNRGVTTTRCRTNPSARAVYPNTLESMLKEMAHIRKHICISEAQTRSTCKETDFSLIW